MSDASSPLDDGTIAAMQVCVDHARDLLDSARTVQSASHPNIAYHLAALALEELGRRQLISLQTITARRAVPPAWPLKHTQSHVQKLFWCFFGGSFAHEKLTGEALNSMKAFAEHIHSKRLEGLYVGSGKDGLSVPAEALKSDEAQSLIELASARLELAEGETLRREISQEDLDLQAWFIDASEDSEKRRQIFSGSSMAKLAEIGAVKEWVLWHKSEFERIEADGHAWAAEELKRERRSGGKEKWKLRIRVVSGSHSVRPKVLTTWNKGVIWIKLSPVPSKKISSSSSSSFSTMCPWEPSGGSGSDSPGTSSWR